MRKLTMAIMLAAASTTAHAATFTNGSFESPGGAPIRQTLGNGDTFVTGWLNNGGFQIYESSGQDGIAAGSGNFYISFGHSGATGGTLSQIFETVIGTTYRVEYLIRQQQGDDPGQSLMVGIAGGPSVSNTGLNAFAWVAGNVLTFTASAATSQLVFTDTTTGGGGGANIALDGVTVTAVPTVSGVPEPATWAMMVLGFGIIGRAMRKGRRQAFA